MDRSLYLSCKNLHTRDCQAVMGGKKRKKRRRKKATKSGEGSSKARKYVYSDQLKFISKLIDERQTADSLWMDNLEESQVTTVEQKR